LPSHLAELARAARISADGTARLTVRLDPPELGAVTLVLHSRGGEVELSLRADTQAGASALATQQARVRDVLASHGFDLARFTVVGSSSANGADSNRDFSQQFGEARRNDADLSFTGRDQQRGSGEPDSEPGRSSSGRSTQTTDSGPSAGVPTTSGSRASGRAANEGTWL
jgi:flagellar hook-length control protein FliK